MTYRQVFERMSFDPKYRKRLDENDVGLPKIQTFRNLVSKVRAARTDSKSERTWTIANSGARNDRDYIEPRDLPIVLQVWRQRFAQGQSLTRRQAKWVARLQHLISDPDSKTYNRLDVLFSAAEWYAHQELVTEVNSPVDRPIFTTDRQLDPAIAFGRLGNPGRPDSTIDQVAWKLANQIEDLNAPSFDFPPSFSFPYKQGFALTTVEPDDDQAEALPTEVFIQSEAPIPIELGYLAFQKMQQTQTIEPSDPVSVSKALGGVMLSLGNFGTSGHRLGLDEDDIKALNEWVRVRNEESDE